MLTAFELYKMDKFYNKDREEDTEDTDDPEESEDRDTAKNE